MKKLFSHLSSFVETLGGIMILAMTLIVLLQVVMRYVFKNSLTWSEELARYLFIYITMLGAGVLVYQRSHLFVEILFNQFKPAARRVVQLVIDGIVALFSGYFGYSSLALMETSSKHASTAMKIPMSYISLSTTIGAALMLLFALYNIGEDIAGIARRGGGRDGDGT